MLCPPVSGTSGTGVLVSEDWGVGDTGVSSSVGVAVTVTVSIGLSVGVAVGVADGVSTGVSVGVTVSVGVPVAVAVAVSVGVGSCWVARVHEDASTGSVCLLVTRTKLHISDTPTGMSFCMAARNVIVTVDLASMVAQVSRIAVMVGSVVPGAPAGV